VAGAFPGERVRFDPNSAFSLADAIEFGRGIADLNNDYYEDPVWGMQQLLRLKEFVDIPTATNTVVINFEQLAENVKNGAVDVILLDTTFWGGIRPCIKAAGVCETFGLGVAVHSSGELGIQLATMLHMGAVVPNLGYAADAHYHHLTDDVIEGGRMKYVDGAIAVPSGPGLGVRLDREKLRQYHELFKALGGYPYDRDPGRPGWYPLIPNTRWADPSVSIVPKLQSVSRRG
jgi:glucarate dehydratase